MSDTVPAEVVLVPASVARRLASLRRLAEAEARRNGTRLPPEMIAAFDIFDWARRGADAASEFRTSSAPPPSCWLDTMTAATALGITDRAVRKMCIEGRIRAAKDRTGAWRIDPKELTR